MEKCPNIEEECPNIGTFPTGYVFAQFSGVCCKRKKKCIDPKRTFLGLIKAKLGLELNDLDGYWENPKGFEFSFCKDTACAQCQRIKAAHLRNLSRTSNLPREDIAVEFAYRNAEFKKYLQRLELTGTLPEVCKNCVCPLHTNSLRSRNSRGDYGHYAPCCNGAFWTCAAENAENAEQLKE